MNALGAAKALVRKFVGGRAAMADALGMSYAVFGNKLDPNNSSNVLSLDDAMRMTDISGDLRVLEAWAAAENCRVVPLDDMASGSLMTTLLERDAATGNVAQVLSAALMDGDISERELLEIERACGDQQAVMIKLVRQVRGMRRPAPKVAP